MAATKGTGTLSGKLLYDMVDYLQETIIKMRRSRTTENWNTLQEFWKMHKLNPNGITDRLIIRQKMCKILMNACSVTGYDRDNPRSLINYQQADWDRLKKALAELVGTKDPYKNKALKKLIFSCSANQLLAKHRIGIEADVKQNREILSISIEAQSRLKNEIHEFIDNLGSEEQHPFGLLMSKLFHLIDDVNGLVLLPPEELAAILGKEPFHFGWVISEIELVVDHCNKDRFGGQEAVLWRLGYKNPGQMPYDTDGSDSPVLMPPPPPRIRSPPTLRTSSTTNSEGDFLSDHPPVVLGSIQKTPPRHLLVASPSNSARKRNPEIYDDNGRVLKRRRWEEGQTTAIIAGLRKYGKRKNRWTLILQEYPELFKDRTSSMIKDRYRTLKNQGEIPDALLAWLGEVEE